MTSLSEMTVLAQKARSRQLQRAVWYACAAPKFGEPENYAHSKRTMQAPKIVTQNGKSDIRGEYPSTY